MCSPRSSSVSSPWPSSFGWSNSRGRRLPGGRHRGSAATTRSLRTHSEEECGHQPSAGRPAASIRTRNRRRPLERPMHARDNVAVPSAARWLQSGYDWPLHRDWLAWLGALATITLIIVAVLQGHGWGAVASLWAFPWCGWLVGAGRAFVRGWRGQEQAPRASR